MAKKLAITACLGLTLSIPLHAQSVSDNSTSMAEVKTEVRSEELSRLEIPQELGPAMSPYLMCRLKAIGVRMPRPDGTLPETSVPSEEDCSPIRKIARRNALTWLAENTELQPRQRVAEVDRTLSDIDRFVDAASPEKNSPSSSEASKK